MRIEEIKVEIKKLPRPDFVEIRKWIADRDWEMWDHELSEDSKAGKLDFLVREALEEKQRGNLRNV